MKRSTFLTLVGTVAALVGAFALLAPETLLVEVKHAQFSPAAAVMARTVGVLLLSIGALNLLVRHHPDSPTMRAILVANLLLQLAILPIDPLAWHSGAFSGLDAFVPNTVLHLLLIAGFARELLRDDKEQLGAGARGAPAPWRRVSATGRRDELGG